MLWSRYRLTKSCTFTNFAAGLELHFQHLFMKHLSKKLCQLYCKYIIQATMVFYPSILMSRHIMVFSRRLQRRTGCYVQISLELLFLHSWRRVYVLLASNLQNMQVLYTLLPSFRQPLARNPWVISVSILTGLVVFFLWYGPCKTWTSRMVRDVHGNLNMSTRFVTRGNI